MKNHPIEATRKWVKDFVIGHNLCPFAKRPFDESRIRFAICESEAVEEQLTDFWREVRLLEKLGSKEVSNTLLIFPKGEEEFEDYLGFFELCEQLLEMQNKTADFQLVSFHPKFQYEGYSAKAARNHSNRSPFPMVHILREEEVSKATDHHENTLEIPKTNEATLNKLFSEGYFD